MFKQKNRWHPLPADYPELTKEGQKLARLAVVKDHSTPEKFVQAWDMFRRLYLQTTEPGFFYDDLVESPKFHYDIIQDVATFPYNVFAAPRGFGKSMVVGIELPLLLLLTRNYYKIALGLSTDKMLERQINRIMKQIEENPFVIEDFGVLKPRRGENIWNNHTLHLRNGSIIDGFSVLGKKRGARPNLFLLDDPEYYDDNSEVRADILHLQFNKILFKEIIPMLRPGCSLVWIGTVINMRCFINYACTEDDPRFNRWNRRVYQAYTKDGDPLWNAMWNEESLEARKEEIGDAAFNSEYMNKPSTEQDRMLALDEEKNEYILTDVSKSIFSPTRMDSVLDESGYVTYSIKPKKGSNTSYEERTYEFSKWIKSLNRFISFDYAEGLRANNDYSCINVFGISRDNCMFILDMWMGRDKRDNLIERIYTYGRRWDCRIIGIEAVGLQKELVEGGRDYIEEMEERLITADKYAQYRPSVIPITYGRTHSKQNRIASCQWRYNRGKIKYPKHLKNDNFGIQSLYSQTLDFTMDLAFLKHDDAIDTIGIAQYMLKNRGIKIEETSEEPTLVERAARGEKEYGGVDIIQSIPTNKIDNDIINRIIMEKYNSAKNKNLNNRQISRGKILKIVR